MRIAMVFMAAVLLSGCSGSNKLADEYQAEMAVLDRLERESDRLRADYERKSKEWKETEERALASHSVDKAKYALNKYLDLAEEFDKTNEPLQRKIEEQKKRLEQIEDRRRASSL